MSISMYMTDNYENIDEKVYLYKKNKDFQNWYKHKIKSGYRCLLNFKEIQELIQHIVVWYEKAYSDSRLTDILYDISLDDFFESFEDIKENIDGLRSELNYNELYTLDCNYKMKCLRVKYRYYDDLIYDSLFITKDGIVNNYNITDLKMYTGISNSKGEIPVEDLYKILSKVSDDDVNIFQLKKYIEKHKIDLSFRNKILELSMINICCRVSNFELGKCRAQILCDEFNQYYNSDISQMEINNLFENSKKSKQKVKTM